jgi:hypothetical protein
MRESLKKLLIAFTCMRPDIGYVQGMSYIAGLMLMYFEEFETFVHFSALMTSSSLLPLYTLNE